MAHAESDFEPMPLDSSPMGAQDKFAHIMTEAGRADELVMLDLLSNYEPTRYSFYGYESEKSSPGVNSTLDASQHSVSGSSGRLHAKASDILDSWATGYDGSCSDYHMTKSAYLRSQDSSSPSHILRVPSLLSRGGLGRRRYELSDEDELEPFSPIKASDAGRSLPDYDDFRMPFFSDSPASAVSRSNGYQTRESVILYEGNSSHSDNDISCRTTSQSEPEITAATPNRSSTYPDEDMAEGLSVAVVEQSLSETLGGELFENADPWRALDRVLDVSSERLAGSYPEYSVDLSEMFSADNRAGVGFRGLTTHGTSVKDDSPALQGMPRNGPHSMQTARKQEPPSNATSQTLSSQSARPDSVSASLSDGITPKEACSDSSSPCNSRMQASSNCDQNGNTSSSIEGAHRCPSQNLNEEESVDDVRPPVVCNEPQPNKQLPYDAIAVKCPLELFTPKFGDESTSREIELDGPCLFLNDVASDDD
ncbi:uncharacterized protein LAESUDRAFT_811915 [Laetiporus sulphureus 93-53]|uniref:Uncharacterized protein n=1 Tax=Laetiporus sulphureus 93-53 TaxID=1314785 RepID=A0A165ES69_9APHY|nr:uncharacterized protein LAESUDRAFT_811915 [Laetiporus sulphureus 93-53]KZT07656.1 hypothetical protein LAESUDRAFT_811915 [Laetiporus sulphureus 93-53]